MLSGEEKPRQVYRKNSAQRQTPSKERIISARSSQTPDKRIGKVVLTLKRDHEHCKSFTLKPYPKQKMTPSRATQSLPETCPLISNATVYRKPVHKKAAS
jgi:hypothetical protein